MTHMVVWWVYLAPQNSPSAVVLTLGNKVCWYGTVERVHQQAPHSLVPKSSSIGYVLHSQAKCCSENYNQIINGEKHCLWFILRFQFLKYLYTLKSLFSHVLNVDSWFSPKMTPSSKWLLWYNRNGWMGVKHKFTYSLTLQSGVPWY